MRVQELIEKMNPNVTFEYIDDSEGDKNRGWTVDEVMAFLDGQYVGYLKLSYIPRERFKRYYPGIMNFMGQIGGNHVLPYKFESTPWQEIPVNELRTRIFSMAQTARIDWDKCNELQQKAKTGSDEEVRAIVADVEKRLWKEFGWKFRRFEKFFVDKPLVDFIRVEGPKRQGIGTALYRAGYEWMKRKGLKLYASGCQSDDAKATWKNMSNQFPITRERTQDPFRRGKRITRKHFT